MTIEIPAGELAEIEMLLGGGATASDWVTATELAEWLSCTPTILHRMGRDGRIPRRVDGKFQLRPAIKAYSETSRKKPNSTLASNPELNAEKIRLARANAEKAETLNARTRGELASLVEIEREWSSILGDVRAALLALPSRAASRLGHLTPHDVKTLDIEVRAILEELADGK